MKQTIIDRSYYLKLLFESETIRILFVLSKTNSNMDRILIIKKIGDKYREPNTIVVYRYEDKEFFNHMLDIYYNN